MHHLIFPRRVFCLLFGARSYKIQHDRLKRSRSYKNYLLQNQIITILLYLPTCLQNVSVVVQLAQNLTSEYFTSIVNFYSTFNAETADKFNMRILYEHEYTKFPW